MSVSDFQVSENPTVDDTPQLGASSSEVECNLENYVKSNIE